VSGSGCAVVRPFISVDLFAQFGAEFPCPFSFPCESFDKIVLKRREAQLVL
jgi:hypothetical protein